MGVSQHPIPHADHDELLVVALASGDLTGDDAVRATGLVDSCTACASLLADVTAIRAATAALPPPRRRRDFRLTDADAARLRPAGWRRFLVPLAGPRFAFTRPLAGALATLGVAGLLVAGVPGLLQSQQASFSAATGVSAPQASAERNSGPAAAQPAAPASDGGQPSLGAAGVAPAASTAGSSDTAVGAPVPSRAPAADQGVTGAGGASTPTEKSVVGSTAGAGGPSALAIVSLVLVVLGSGLFALRWSARRLGRA